jgi:hypothetical protein
LTGKLDEFGVTRHFDSGRQLRAAYVFNENPVPDADFSLRAADMDQHFFSVGTGFNGKTFNFDTPINLAMAGAHSHRQHPVILARIIRQPKSAPRRLHILFYQPSCICEGGNAFLSPVNIHFALARKMFYSRTGMNLAG